MQNEWIKKMYFTARILCFSKLALLRAMFKILSSFQPKITQKKILKIKHLTFKLIQKIEGLSNTITGLWLTVLGQ